MTPAPKSDQEAVDDTLIRRLDECLRWMPATQNDEYECTIQALRNLITQLIADARREENEHWIHVYETAIQLAPKDVPHPKVTVWKDCLVDHRARLAELTPKEQR